MPLPLRFHPEARFRLGCPGRPAVREDLQSWFQTRSLRSAPSRSSCACKRRHQRLQGWSSLVDQYRRYRLSALEPLLRLCRPYRLLDLVVRLRLHGALSLLHRRRIVDLERPGRRVDGREGLGPALAGHLVLPHEVDRRAGEVGRCAVLSDSKRNPAPASVGREAANTSPKRSSQASQTSL